MNPVKSAFKEINQSLVTLDSVFNPKKAKEEKEIREKSTERMLNDLNDRLENLDKHTYHFLLFCSLLHAYQRTTPSDFTSMIKNVLNDREKAEKMKSKDLNSYKELVDSLRLALTAYGLELKNIDQPQGSIKGS